MEHLKKRHFECSILESCDDGELYEIFLRLPDQRSAVQCSTVCKRWLSLISSPKFCSDFVKHHTDRLTDDAHIPYTLLTRIKAFDFTFFSILEFYTNNGGGRPNGCAYSYLHFLPWSGPALVKASWGDLLLVSELGSKNNFIVCNPATKQWVALQSLPSFVVTDIETCCLFCEPANNNNSSISFKVCFLIYFHDGFKACTFCSETGQWTKTKLIMLLQHRRTRLGKVVILDRSLHFINRDSDQAVGVSVFRPLQDPKTVVSFTLPVEFGRRWRSSVKNTHLGVVRGRLRLSQMFACNHGFSLKIWEFDTELSAPVTWVLMHNVYVKRPNKNNKNKHNNVFVVAFDPNDGNTVFLVDGLVIFRYEIDSGKCVIFDDGRPGIKSPLGTFAKAFILMQPFWHTTIPSLPVPPPILNTAL